MKNIYLKSSLDYILFYINVWEYDFFVVRDGNYKLNF